MQQIKYDKEGHFLMLKVIIDSEEITGFHIYAPKNIATIFMNQ